MCAFIPALAHCHWRPLSPDLTAAPTLLSYSLPGVAVLPQLPLVISQNSSPHLPLTWPLIIGGFPALRRFLMEIWGLHDDLQEPNQTLRDSKTVREKEREGGRESEKRTRPSRRTFRISKRKRKGERQTNEANQLQLFELQYLHLFDNLQGQNRLRFFFPFYFFLFSPYFLIYSLFLRHSISAFYILNVVKGMCFVFRVIHESKRLGIRGFFVQIESWTLLVYL